MRERDAKRQGGRIIERRRDMHAIRLERESNRERLGDLLVTG